MCLTYRIILTAQSKEREKLEDKKEWAFSGAGKGPKSDSFPG